MKLNVKQNARAEDPLVTVEYAQADDEVRAILVALNSLGRELLGKRESELVRIPLDAVLYCESVDGTTFLYLADNVVESPLHLAEIDKKTRHTTLVRISRTVMANLAHARSIRPFPNARLQLLMDNGEYLIASRQFAPAVKKCLGL